MTNPPLWERLRRARVVQVLLVYLGASWVVLQIAETLTEALSLPEWVPPVAVILLLVGLVVILATTWIQSLPATTAGEAAGELPTDWEIAPGDALASLKAGRLPHLTWGRAIMGGVVALALLFGGAGIYVGYSGRPVVELGPTEVGATDADEGIAVVPFKVSGAELEVWQEGMVDLLSTNLDGMGGFRAIDSRTVIARWREVVEDDEAPDLQTSLRVAGRTGARYAVVGSAVGVGDNLRLVTEVYDLSDGREIGSAQAEGSPDEVMELVDRLSVETVRALMAGGGEELATSRNLADLTTSSLPALRAYLEGERRYRHAEFPQAVDAYERALEADPDFALALFRLSDTYGWLENIGSERAVELGERSIAVMDRLTPRNAILVAAGNALYSGDLSYLEDLESAVRKYPDDPEIWFLLGETYFHLGEVTQGTYADAEEAITRAVDLDPSFAPYHVHAADVAILRGDREAARTAMGAYEQLSGSKQANPEQYVAFDLFLGDATERAAGAAAAMELDERDLSILWGQYAYRSENLEATRLIAETFRERTGQPGWNYALLRIAANQGRWVTAEAMLRDSLQGGPEARHAYLLHRFARSQPDEMLDAAALRSCDPRNCDAWSAAAFAAEEGDWDRHRSFVDFLPLRADSLAETGDTLQARRTRVASEAIEAYGRLRQGDANGARTILERVQGQVAPGRDAAVRLWLAEAYEAMGRRQEALHWYELLLNGDLRSYAHYRMAGLAEELGDEERARAEWNALLMNYEQADPDNPRLAEARDAMARLGG
jgi:tetratricopeptide (TPR) repeat protein